jgi:hypothetical protein
MSLGKLIPFVQLQYQDINPFAPEKNYNDIRTILQSL